MRVSTTFVIPDSEPLVSAQSSGLLAETLKREMPANVEQSTRVFIEDSDIRINDRIFSVDVAYTDPDFIEIFEPLSLTDARLAFEPDPSAIYLSETQAFLLFGETSVIGQTLQFTKTDKLRTVRGVFKDFPRNSHMQIDALTFLDVGQFEDRNYITSQWTSLQVYTYSKIRDAGSLAQLREQAPALVNRNIDFQFPGRPDLATSDIIKLKFEPVESIHLGETKSGSIKPSGNKAIVYLLTAVGISLILITALNFGILFSALVENRSAETHLRKTLGATRKDIIFQFGSNSVLTLLLSGIVSIPITWLILLVLNKFVAIPMSDELKSSGQTLIICLATFAVLIIGLSLLPASHAAHSKVKNRPNFNLNFRGIRFNSMSLYGFIQNFVSISLVTVVVILFAQSRHLSNLSLQFETKDIHIAAGFEEDIAPILRNLESSYAFSGNANSLASASEELPLRGFSSNNITLKGDRPLEKQVQTIHVSPNLLNLLNAQSMAGKSFTDQLARDAKGPNEVIVNQAFLRLYELNSPKDAIQKKLTGAVRPDGPVVEMNVIGVVKDLKLRGQQSEPEPMIFSRQSFDQGSVIFASEKPIANSATNFETTLRDLFPLNVVEVLPLSDKYARLNSDLDRTNAAFAFFSVLAIVLTLMGIFGVSQLSIIKNRRVIALKKVLGAKSSTLLITDLIRSALPVCLTALIAIPIVYVLASDWLTKFPSRVNVQDLVPQFLVIIFLSVFVKWLVTTASIFSIFKTNPSEVFRRK